MPIYERTRDNLVIIKRGYEQDVLLNRANCLRAIKNVKANRAHYATDKAYLRALAMYQEALHEMSGIGEASNDQD